MCDWSTAIHRTVSMTKEYPNVKNMQVLVFLDLKHTRYLPNIGRNFTALVSVYIDPMQPD